MTDLVPLALNAGDTTRAHVYAKDLLVRDGSMKEDRNYGDAIHNANLVLGRIALASGDVGEAKRLLLEAGKTPGSPTLNSFGPDMLFAKELLEKGEKAAVFEYFKLCSKFWKLEDGRLAEWRTTIENGQMPDFGANLVYIFRERGRQ